MMRPRVEMATREFTPIIQPQGFRFSVLQDEPVQHLYDIASQERGPGFGGQALSTELVQNIEDSNPLAIGQLVGHEIQAPSLVHVPGWLQGDSTRRCDLPTALGPY